MELVLIHPINEFNLIVELSKVTSNTVGKMLCSQMSNCSLTLKDLVISESCTEIKIKLNFYFHTSLWCLKRFYEGLKGLHKTF